MPPCLLLTGGAMYFVTLFCVGVVLVLLRFGPRVDMDSNDQFSDVPDYARQDSGGYGQYAATGSVDYPAGPPATEMTSVMGSLRAEKKLSGSHRTRSRPQIV